MEYLIFYFINEKSEFQNHHDTNCCICSLDFHTFSPYTESIKLTFCRDFMSKESALPYGNRPKHNSIRMVAGMAADLQIADC